jgi:competence protein ComEC
MKSWLLKRAHVSWFVAWASAGVLIGAAFSLLVNPRLFADSTWLIFAVSLFFVICFRRFRFLLIAALICGMLTGLWRGSVERNALLSYEPFYGQTVTLHGKIVEDTSYGPKGDQRMRLGSVQIANQKLTGEIWISSDTNLDIKRGDNVTTQGNLNEGFGNLPASMFRAKVISVERPNPGDIARRARDWFGAAVQSAIPAPESSLGIGYLDGQRSALPETLDQQLKMIGLTHVVVASGYNLTILVRFARRALVKKSKYLATLAGGSMIISFVAITGLSPSMSRAGLITGLSLLAWYWGRVIHPLVLLPFAAAVTVLMRPAYAWGDIGWCLSFAAFAGVIILAPLLQSYFWGRKKNPNFLTQILIETTSAQIATLPIILLIFGQYSVYALPANLLILPLVPIAMLLTFVAGLGALLLTDFASIFGWPAYGVLHYMTTLVSWIANLPGAQSDVQFGLSALIASYIAIVTICVLLYLKTKYSFRNASIIE